MNNSALKDIQQLLNIICTKIEKVDSETKMAALKLTMSATQSAVAMARKLTKPKVSTKTKKLNNKMLNLHKKKNSRINCEC